MIISSYDILEELKGCTNLASIIQIGTFIFLPGGDVLLFTHLLIIYEFNNYRVFKGDADT